MSRAERLLSYSLLALITSKPLASASTTLEEEDEEEDEIPPLTDKGKGVMNTDGAWCWREGCPGESERRRDGVNQLLTKTTL
jgi:sorting nexin-9/18/33